MIMIFMSATGLMIINTMVGLHTFVEKLNQELSATLKDKLSIFFDKEPEEQRESVWIRVK